jgi:hypothetical protein
MIEYCAFGLGGDGLTTVVELGDYRINGLESQGWTMVGLCSVEKKDEDQRVFGVFRISDSKRMVAALQDMKETEGKYAKALTEKRKLDEQVVNLTARVADLQRECDRLREGSEGQNEFSLYYCVGISFWRPRAARGKWS